MCWLCSLGFCLSHAQSDPAQRPRPDPMSQRGFVLGWLPLASSSCGPRMGTRRAKTNTETAANVSLTTILFVLLICYEQLRIQQDLGRT